MVKAKTKTARRRSSGRPSMAVKELDSVYFLKMVLYLILGALWVRVGTDTFQVGLPIGLIVGVAIASRERFQIDRKIEYAILLIAMFVGFWLPLGLTIIV